MNIKTQRNPDITDVIGDDWRTPNAYCNKFASLGDFSAVYLLVVYKIGDFGTNFDDFSIAYVGMSKRLSKRFANHHAVELIQSRGFYYQIWFKQVDADKLRDAERELIRKYDPPLNLIGKLVALK